MNNILTNIRCVLVVMLLLCCSIAKAQDADSVAIERPVASFYMASVGSASILDTYLSPVRNEGGMLRLEYERFQAMKFNPERWIMQMNVGIDYANVNNPARNHVEHALMVDFRWGMMHRWKDVLTPKLNIAVGGSAQFRGGAIYKPSNSNNVVSAKIHAAVSATALASYDVNVGKLPITISYQATLPVLGAFFSPEYGESYYEIYLGNRQGLAHLGWWGNRFDLINFVSADLHLSRTVLRIGYRNSIESSWINNLNTQIYTHSAVIGVGGEWLSVGKRDRNTKAKMISAIY